ncbi:MAG: EscU/YscU/HrcU family type III secretion system export apparatus switch protein [Pseudomonadota bacterium]
MSGDQSEEKTLPASKRKLRKQREKGQVVTSRETVMSIVGIVALIYLYTMRFDISEKLTALWILEPEFEGQSFMLQFQSKVSIVWSLGLQLVLPLTGMVIGVSILTGMFITGGPVFSLDPIAPTFDKINPASGFKKILGRRALMSFLMNFLRLTILAIVFGLVLYGAWEALILAPVCGLGCAMETLDSVILPMVIGAVAVMATMALFDYIVQRAEFMHEQKMTLSEFKREMKDQMGDPHLRGQLKRERKQMLTSPTGPSQATLVVTAGSGLAVGIRYKENETPAPMIVARVKTGPAIRNMLRKSGALEHADPELARSMTGIAVGGFITDDDLIARIAPLLQRAATL